MHGELLWSPPADAWERTRLGRFLRGIDPGFDRYEDAWRWSVAELDRFWQAVWDEFDIRAHEAPTAVLADRRMPGAVWFPGARLNYAEHALRATGDREVVVARSQSREGTSLSGDQLRDRVAEAAAGLRRLGVGPGDRVGAYLPNIPEAVVAFLATASIGAVWSSCAPEFGVRSVIDRFGQIQPTVLLAVDGYRYGDKSVGRGDEVDAIRAALPGLEATVVVPYLDAGADPPEGTTSWDDLLSESAPLTFEPVPFDHPLYVLYSSGTTGLPKPIVHGHGGILLEHHKIQALHFDIGPDDRFFWFSTTGWMMWNFLVSGLLVDATVVLYDGNPGWPDQGELWRVAAETGVTWFGVSATYLMACRKAGVHPREVADLGAVRAIGSTGAPLPAEGYRWVYDELGPDVFLSSTSGGTDVCTSFVGGTPLVPVRAGEIGARFLGCAVEAFDDGGAPVVGAEGELVLTAPMPSMPVGFWGDGDGSRYRAAYFARYPGVWDHGDWVTIHEDGSLVISGRSDATLNRGGVRLGTAELYAVVESLDDVVDSLVVHLEDAEGGPGRLLLFVVLRDGADLATVDATVRATLRAELSPRHVPDEITAVPAVPRTLSGKKLEIPVKRILRGVDPAVAAAAGALADPTSLDPFVRMASTST